MDYLGWELERQRAALWALLGAGGAEEEEAPVDAPSGWGGKDPAEGTRRSPASLGRARRRGSGRAGRYAAGRGEAGGPLAGAPGAWEMVREAGGIPLNGTSGGPETPMSAWEGYGGKEAGTPAREWRGPETDAPEDFGQTALEGARKKRRGGTGAAEGLLSAGAGAEPEERESVERETAAGSAAETPARYTGGRRAGRAPAGEEPALAAGEGPSPGEGPVGRETAGGTASVVGRGGSGRASSGPWARSGRTGQGERLSRSLPWGGGWESAALRAEDTARILSRAVQRDARRYDGGFTIY